MPNALQRAPGSGQGRRASAIRPNVQLSRRQVLAAAAGLAARPALALSDASRFVPAIAQHGGKWDGRLSSLRRLAWEVQRRTSVEVSLEARPLPLASPRLFDHPFLALTGEGELPPLQPAEVENLRRFVTFGGFLLVDASDGSDGDGFDRAVRRELARVLPQSPLEPLSPEHVVFKSFFLLDGAAGRLARKPYLSAARVGDRAAVVYSQNDLLGALARDEAGEYAFDPDPGGEAQREQAVRLAINVCLYALCLDYKDDAVHLPLILNKRR